MYSFLYILFRNPSIVMKIESQLFQMWLKGYIHLVCHWNSYCHGNVNCVYRVYVKIYFWVHVLYNYFLKETLYASLFRYLSQKSKAYIMVTALKIMSIWCPKLILLPLNNITLTLLFSASRIILQYGILSNLSRKAENDTCFCLMFV